MGEKLSVTTLVGSLREASLSRVIMDSIVDFFKDYIRTDEISIGSLPHYCEDLEKNALPSEVCHARQQVSSSDAVIIVTPEFNHGIPGVLKNALDWLSRPAFESPMQGKHVFFITQSPGKLGGVRAQVQLRETLASMRCRLSPLPEVVVTFSEEKVEDGQLKDAITAEFIRQQLTIFFGAVTTPSHE